MNRVELLSNGVIYVEKVGKQNEATMTDLHEAVNAIGRVLRQQGKPVYVLLNASRDKDMDIKARKVADKIGTQMDYDKSASYGASEYVRELRELMIKAHELHDKVANFETREQALDWLLQ